MKKQTLLELLDRVKTAEKEKTGKLPGNSYFLGDDRILCLERERGESRYPYDTDGLVVWLHSNGWIDACESTFTIFRTSNFGEESPVQFFGGIQSGDGTYFPISVTGASKQSFEKDVKRYVVYSPKCAYCITECKDTVFAMRLHVDENKHIRFALSAYNASKEKKHVYLSSFAEAMLRKGESEGFWSRMTKFGEVRPGGFMLWSLNEMNDRLVINRKVVRGCPQKEYFTASRDVFTGAGRIIANSKSLRSGTFDKEFYKTNTTELPVAAEITHFDLAPDEDVSIEYEITLVHGECDVDRMLSAPIDEEATEKELFEREAKERADYSRVKVEYKNWKSDRTDADTFNKFYRCVQKQTSFCAHGKNYAGAYLGIRDVFQQLEGALIWQPEKSREKIVLALNYILDTGRPPRMFSLPKNPNDPTLPIPLCTEKYIDQGVWIISTVFTYLSFTGDFSILNEVCDYVDAPDINWIDSHKTGERDTVLEHLIRITEFLASNIDTEYGTNCLRVLFGDWNDAVDGLGKTDDPDREFGSGVTVMATLQFRQNLREMIEILRHVGGYPELVAKYDDLAAKIGEGLERFAIDKNEKGEKRIVHGWGDKVAYKVASFNDPDGESRYSLTANAFWAITGFVKRDPSLKKSIMSAFDALSSKYGLKTFDKPFSEDCHWVGRIRKIVPGTYENSCAYAHGSLFGTMGLFALGESKRAWEEIEKTAVITHENATRTAFIMPNSYCENSEYGMGGDSMGDWHTGSGCVLAKEIIRYGFGVSPTLDGIFINPPSYFPAKSAHLEVPVKGITVTVDYKETGEGRSITVNGAHYTKDYDEFLGITSFFIADDDITGNITVTVTD